MIDFKYESPPAGFRRLLMIVPCADGTQSVAAVDITEALATDKERWRNAGAALGEALFIHQLQHTEAPQCSKESKKQD